MRSVLFVTDAWTPQVNGVVRTMQATIAELERRGLRCEVISPDQFTTLPCPTYPEIPLSLTTSRRLARQIAAADCDHVHISTEGPLGVMAVRALRRMGRTWTTSYHTRFPEYLAARARVPLAWSYAWLRRFHNRAGACMVATPSLEEELEAKGFTGLVRWSRGVDTDLFCPSAEGDNPFAGLPGPIWLNVGRVAVEKNLAAFLDLDLPGTKVVVGDGPQLAELRARYPDARFIGSKFGAELARCYNGADAFVFPSLTDTLGLVQLEAMACGVPVAAFPVTGPKQVVEDGRSGVLSEDLRSAALGALQLSAAQCRARALSFGWAACTDAFLDAAKAAEDRHAQSQTA